MFFHFLLLMTCSVRFLHGSRVSSCDENCADKPVFTPSQLVVKYGSSASVMCSVCQHACLTRLSGLEVSAGRMRQNGTMILWQVKRLTEWAMDAICYYNMDDKQCCSTLPVTVYKPPDNVSISFVGHALECIVQNVAPVKNLTVTFYRGQTALDQQFSSNANKKPMIASFTLDITTSKKGTGGQYWCEAKLDLGPEGPQPPPVMSSQNITVAMEHLPDASITPSGHLQFFLIPIVTVIIIITIIVFIIFKSSYRFP